MNYHRDQNPFNLLAPPSWWLRGVEAFDPDLVLIPSRLRPVHLLCRRAGRFSKGAAPLAIGHTLDADSKLYVEYGVLPVSWIDCATWSMGALTYLLDNLKARDTWHVNGPLDEAAQKRALFDGETPVSKALDDRDKAAEAKIARENRDMIHYASGEAWRFRQHLVGERVSVPAPATRGEAHQPEYTNTPYDPVFAADVRVIPAIGDGMPKHDEPATPTASAS